MGSCACKVVRQPDVATCAKGGSLAGDNLDPTAVADQDVLGLHVAVDQSGVMGCGEGSKHRLDDLECPGRGQRRLPIQHVAQGLALDVLHHDVGTTVGPSEILALIENRDHIRVGQRRLRAPRDTCARTRRITEPDMQNLTATYVSGGSTAGHSGHPATGSRG